MAAPVTNQNYTQQVNQAFDMLKYATPQQMQFVTQQVQQNPNSPEAIALAMASQYQQQARAPQPQAPQGTILEQKLAQFQQTAGPAQGGLPAVGQNQMDLQQSAQQDPMRNAGIGIAPENTEPQQEQTAATGGIVALAGGGQVEHFANGGGLGSIHPTYSMSTPEDMSAANQGLGFLGGFAKSDEYDLDSDEYGLEPVKEKIPRFDPVETPANPNSSAAKEAASPTAKESIASIRELLGPEADLSEEVATAREMAKEAGKDKWLGAMAQGIGGMLSAKTPYTSQAFGSGLLAGASGYAQGAQEERAAKKDLMALEGGLKKAATAGNKEAVTMHLNSMMKQQEAAAAAKAKQQEIAAETRAKYGVAGIEGEYGLKKQELSNDAAVTSQNLTASNNESLKILEKELESTGVPSDKTMQALYTSAMSGLTASGRSPSPERIKAAVDQAIELVIIRGKKTPTPKPSTIKPVGSKLFVED